MTFIDFQPNKPELLIFGDSKPVVHLSGELAYTLGDGRTLRLAPTVAQSLADLKLVRGERFLVCLQTGPKEPYWSVWLAPETELARAKVESPGLRLVRSHKQASSARNGDSEFLPGFGVLRPNSAESAGRQADPISPKLTGGDRRRPAGGRIPMNVAFREITRFVAAELKAAGEQWGDEARQDFVSTVLIQAQRQKLIGPWERGAA